MTILSHDQWKAIKPDHQSLWGDLRGVPFSQGWIDAGGIETRYLHSGDKAQPPLILLHGVGGHAEAYIRNLGAHGAHFSTWAIDMIGHGWSSKPDHDYEIEAYIDHLAAFIDAIGAEKIHLSGESLDEWGGRAQCKRTEAGYRRTHFPAVHGERQRWGAAAI
jgi:2-hydroxy-6-oxonona-2,4-dienedioate hydrolase